MEEYKKIYKNAKVTSFSSQISKDWKTLSSDEKEKWKKVAEQDKLRYLAEKSIYTGPWLVPKTTERAKKVNSNKMFRRRYRSIIVWTKVTSHFSLFPDMLGCISSPAPAQCLPKLL
jgi:hypothetical protein